jgi:hypothetical protein
MFPKFREAEAWCLDLASTRSYHRSERCFPRYLRPRDRYLPIPKDRSTNHKDLESLEREPMILHRSGKARHCIPGPRRPLWSSPKKSRRSPSTSAWGLGAPRRTATPGRPYRACGFTVRILPRPGGGQPAKPDSRRGIWVSRLIGGKRQENQPTELAKGSSIDICHVTDYTY